MTNIDIGADSKAEVGDLTEAIQLAESYIRLNEQIQKAENDLKDMYSRQHALESKEIPEAMQACRAKQLPLLSGGHMEVKEITKCSIPSAGGIEKEKDDLKKAEMRKRLNDALSYLRKNGGEPLIKNFITLEFDKGKDNVVSQFVVLAEDTGVPYCKETTVHNSSLERFIKELLAKGKAVPKDTFGLYTGSKAVIVKPRKKSKQG